MKIKSSVREVWTRYSTQLAVDVVEKKGGLQAADRKWRYLFCGTYPIRLNINAMLLTKFTPFFKQTFYDRTCKLRAILNSNKITTKFLLYTLMSIRFVLQPRSPKGKEGHEIQNGHEKACHACNYETFEQNYSKSRWSFALLPTKWDMGKLCLKSYTFLLKCDTATNSCWPLPLVAVNVKKKKWKKTNKQI